MIKKSVLLLLTVILSFFLNLSAVPVSKADTGVETSREALNHLKNMVFFKRLNNGLRIIIYRRGYAPVFAGMISVRVGSTDEVPGETGISHMLEHMAFKGSSTIGTKDYQKEKVLLDELENLADESDAANSFTPEQRSRWDAIVDQLKELWVSEEYSRELEKRGAVGLNAMTGPELTQYYVNLPSSQFEFWCRMESERLLHPVMRMFYQERSVVHEEQRMRSEDDPEGKLSEQLFSTAFQMHPYHQPVIGYVDDLTHLTARKLEKFWRKYYVPSNMVVSLVGDIDPQRDLPLIEQYFGRLPAGAEPERIIIKERAQEGERYFELMSKAYPQLVVGYKKPSFPDPDDARLSIMFQTLLGSKTSPVYKELVLKKRLALGVDYSEGPGEEYPNLGVIHVIPRAPHSNKDLLGALERILAEFKAKGVSQEELEIAKREIAVSYLQGMNSNLGLADHLASVELIHGGWQSAFKWYDELMSVSREDVQRVANQYLILNTRTVGMLEMEGEKK